MGWHLDQVTNLESCSISHLLRSSGTWPELIDQMDYLVVLVTNCFSIEFAQHFEAFIKGMLVAFHQVSSLLLLVLPESVHLLC